MKIHFLLQRRIPDGPSQIVLAVSSLLEQQGFEIASTVPEEALLRPERLTPEADLWVLKSYTPLSLTLAGVLHASGARILNPYPACVAARNKILAAQVLHAAGIPAPRSWVTGDLSLLAPLAHRMALVVKPSTGWRGEGVRFVRGEADLLALPRPTEPVLVQELVPGPGVDLRVYVAGDEVFATRKPFSSTSFSVPGEEVEVTPQVRRIALRCGEAFGLGLFGLDVIESPEGPRVVDVNTFPGYKGIARAPEAVARYIAAYARSRVSTSASRTRAAESR